MEKRKKQGGAVKGYLLFLVALIISNGILINRFAPSVVLKILE